MAVKIISGHAVLLDDDIVEIINNMGGWCVNPSAAKKHNLFYFRHDNKKSRKKKHQYIYLHRLICGAGPTEVVDHISGDTLDNRRANLRAVNRLINSQNTRPHKKKSNLPPGVRFRKDIGKYEARITQNGKTFSLGYFIAAQGAQEAYKNAEIEKYSGIRRNIHPTGENAVAVQSVHMEGDPCRPHSARYVQSPVTQNPRAPVVSAAQGTLAGCSE